MGFEDRMNKRSGDDTEQERQEIQCFARRNQITIAQARSLVAIFVRQGNPATSKKAAGEPQEKQ